MGRGDCDPGRGALLLPYLLVPLYRVVNPVSTPMLWRWATGARVEHSFVPLDRMAPALPVTVIASEDGRFCSHRGIDWREISERLEDADISEARGVSTITQQTAKNLFLWHGRSFVRKGLEFPLALWIPTSCCRSGACSKSISMSRNGVRMGSTAPRPEAASRSRLECVCAERARSRAARRGQNQNNNRRSLMLRAEDNKFLTVIGSGHRHGRIAPPLLGPRVAVRRTARGRRHPEKDHGDGRGTARLPRYKRRRRRHRPVLPAPRRQSLARSQRGMRHPLRLSRLEVRHRRPLRRHADLLPRSQRQGPDPHQVLSGARMGRHDLGL